LKTTASFHLTDGDVARFVSGELSLAERNQARAHIDSCAQCRATVFATTESGPRDRGGAPMVPLAARTLVGRYIVLELIGSGGMGAVYAAVDPKLGRRVALKLLRSDRTSAERRALLLREAQVLARINHPNVATVYDVGDVDGQVFLAMELVEGGTLREWMRARPRGWREVLAMLCAAGDGVLALHRAGLVHHDFKPDNVLIGADGRPRVTDFGLALPVGTRLERRGGTPAYMAPEQMLGDPADARADIFAFCVTLWEALYGARPFDGESLSTLRDAIQSGVLVEPPRDRAVPAWLRRLVSSGLRPNPVDRPPSLEALLARLRVDPSRRLRRWLVAASVVGLAAGGGVAVERVMAARAASCAQAGLLPDGIWDAGRRAAMKASFAKTGVPYADVSFATVSGALDEYARAWRAMRVEACEATRVRRVQPDEVLALRMTCLDDRARQLRAATEVLSSIDARGIDQAPRVVDDLSSIQECADATTLAKATPRPKDPEVRARLERALGQLDLSAARSQLGHFDEAAKIAAAARAEIDAIGHAPTRARAATATATALSRAGKVVEATRVAEEAVELAQRGHDDESEADALAVLCFASGFLSGKTDEALTYARWALALAERNHDDNLVREIRFYRGLVLSNTDRLEEAQADLEFVVAARERLNGRDTLEAAEARSNLGVVFNAQGRLVQAGEQFARTVTTLERLIGPGTAEAIPARNNLGSIQVQLGQLDAARATLERLIPDAERAYGKESPSLTPTLINLGELRLAERRYAEAAALFERALAIIEQLGRDHVGLVEPLTQLGLVRLADGRPREALALAERALTIAKTRGLAGPDLARTQLALARALVATKGDRARAKELASSAEGLFRSLAKRFGGESGRWADEAHAFVATL